jgi:hypothetical protein
MVHFLQGTLLLMIPGGQHQFPSMQSLLQRDNKTLWLLWIYVSAPKLPTDEKKNSYFAELLLKNCLIILMENCILRR